MSTTLGAGRLAFELAARGYDVEANEKSASMCQLAHAVLLRLARGGVRGSGDAVGAEPLVVYPLLHLDRKNRWDGTERHMPVVVLMGAVVASLLGTAGGAMREVEVVSRAPRLYRVRGFATDAEMDKIIEVSM